MFFYIYILIIFCIYTCICLNNKDLITIASLDAVSPSSIGLKFVTQVNNTSEMDYLVELRPDQCCLVLDDGVDCESMQIIGGSLAAAPKGTTKNLNLIAPLIDPFERYGYCTFYLDSYLSDRKRNIMRDEIKVKFDTRLSNKQLPKDISETLQPCRNLDEDPMNDCNPVNCDVHYNGVKQFYSKKEKRCIDTPTCVSSVIDDPDIIYNPITNKCVREAGVSDEDLEYIKSLDNNDRHTKDIMIIKNVEPKEDLSIDSNDKECPNCKNVLNIHQKITAHKYHSKGTFKTVVAYLMANKNILIVLGLVIVVQCCLICTMIYCLSKSCSCCKKKKVESKYFNYRQDASVTTPLIYTSNNDTETTDYQFVSDSSNVDKKIKCYKACQKERNSNPQMSMSDDILSKCLNRRKWDRITKSDAIREEIEAGRDKTEHVPNKVTFDDSNQKNIEDGINENEQGSGESQEGFDIRNDMSEKEIKCHTYNYYDERTNMPNFKANDRNGEIVKNTSSNSTEKGAQACFSNDSIDDFLSDRGIIFLTEGNLSNSQSSSEPMKSTATSLSSKTSKNNVVKNVLSYLSRRSKPSSVPGTKKSKENIDLQLIHMSRATVFSSSSRSDNALKRMRNSKTSL